MANSKAGAGRGVINPQRTDESDETYVTPKERYEMRKYQDAMNADYESRANMLGKTKQQYIKDQAAKENEALQKTPISSFMTDTMINNGKKKGGTVRSSASKRADGIAVKGHTRGKYL